jgi:hypothetical protein
MGFASPARRGAAPAVKENGLDAAAVANRRQCLFGCVDRPIGLQIPAIFGSVGKSQHDGLSVPALNDMRPVWRYVKECLHDWSGVFHAFHGLEQRDDVDRHHVTVSPPAPP